MTLESIYYFSQIVAVLAILASLIFVGIQIQQNTKAMRAAATQALHDNFANWYEFVANNPSTHKLMLKALADRKPLTDEENLSFTMTIMVLLSYTQSAFYHWRDGDLSDELWHSLEATSISFFASPGGKSLWARRKYVFTPTFSEYVDTNLLNRELPAEARIQG